MNIGTIKKWIDSRGFGFIKADDGSEYFCHITALTSGFKPQEGLRVRFVIGLDPKNNRECAQQVRVA